MVSCNKENSLIIYGHWKSQDWRFNDNWAIFWNKTERQMILDFVSKLNWFTTYWYERKTIWQKLSCINDNLENWKECFPKEKYEKIKCVFEIHYDVRWENSQQWTKILYAWQTSEKEILNFQENTAFAKLVQESLWWRMFNNWGLYLLNSSTIPTLMIEVWDPNLSDFKNTEDKVLQFFNNL